MKYVMGIGEKFSENLFELVGYQVYWNDCDINSKILTDPWNQVILLGFPTKCSTKLFYKTSK